MANQRITINLSKYGLPEPIVVDVPVQAMGDDGKMYDYKKFPRNAKERKLYSTYINEAAMNQFGEDFTGLPPKLIDYMVQYVPTEAIMMAKKLQQAKELSQQQKADPLGFDAAVQSYKAKQK